jgi:peptide/nickel transport system substrate-binding protein
MKKTGILLLVGVLFLGLAVSNSWAARSGGTLNFMAPYGGDLYGLDPHKSTRVQDFLVSMNIQRCLYRWDPDLSKPVLDLATSVDVSADGLVYTYQLRKNVKFHNGRAMTADDIIWSYNRIMSPKVASPYARYVRIIKGAQAMEQGKAASVSGLQKKDDYTLEITLEAPVNPSYSLRRLGTAILPKEEVEKKGDGFTTDPVGCGPFQFVKWVKGSEVVLKKFPGYYEAGRPYLDKVVYKIMGEGAARDIAFRAKELDATIVGAAQYPVYQRDPVISKNMIEVAEMFTRQIGFNQDYKPFANKKVRQAINYAINKDLIIEKLLKGKAVSPVSFLPTTSPAFNKNAKPYTYNPEKAKALLKEAGYEGGFTYECIGTANKSWGVGVVEATIPFLKKIGITVKIQQMEGAAMAEKIKSGNYQAYIWSLGSGPDPLQALRRWKSDNPRTAGNYVAYNNAEFDKLLEDAADERDDAKKMEILKKADGVFLDDAPIWFFNYNKAVMAYHPWVHGLKPVAIEMMYQDLTSVWVGDDSPRATAK